MIFLPPMPPEQTASWIGLLDLHERLAAAEKDRALLLEVPDAENSLDRLATAGEW